MVVSEEFERQFSPERSALGQCLRVQLADGPCYVIVGIAANAHGFRVVEEPVAAFYVPLAQHPTAPADRPDVPRAMVVRTTGDPAPIVTFLRSQVGDTVSRASLRPVALLAERLERQYRPWELGARLFAGSAALALVLAAFGLYSVTAHAVAARRHELGVRRALGASDGRLIGTVIRGGMRQTIAGVVAGIGVALFATRLLSDVLHDVSPRDPLVLGSAAAVMLAAAIGAALVPARRATRVDPMVALREE